MKTRIVLGGIVIAALIAFFALDRVVGGGWFVCGLALIAAGWGFAELARLIALAPPLRHVAAIVIPATIVCATDIRSFLIAAVTAPAAFAIASLRIETPAEARSQLGRAVLAWGYLGIGAASLVLIRMLPGGWALVITTVVATKFADIGAYFTGRAIGKTPMCPRLSPKKTVEGLLGGLALAAVGALLLGVVIFDVPSLAWWSAPLFGAIVGGVGTLGDLVESQFKRAAGEKDSGTVLPEFGGMLDMIDSPLVSAPVAFAVLLLLA